MPRANTGGKSIRLDVAFPNDLYSALQKWMRRHKVSNDSEAVRIAVANLVGTPELAEGITPGRPKSDAPRSRRGRR